MAKYHCSANCHLNKGANNESPPHKCAQDHEHKKLSGAHKMYCMHVKKKLKLKIFMLTDFI